eukprot:GFKZ01013784.1.p1 GENE.GFKZ01013784.1~~GFKZ01013784.1.p1  ORF type:complete len:489 (+),score=54.09 GFKZ01013784.1:423-1889(+)
MDSELPEANLSALFDGPNPTQASDENMTQSNPNRIVNFDDAIAALRRHSFRNVPDFKAACKAARKLHRNTAVAINTADINDLQAARDQLHPVDHYLAFISTMHASLAAAGIDSPIVPHLVAEVRSVISGTDTRLVQAVPIRWVGMCRHAARLAIESRNTLLALSLIQPLREAASKLSPAPDILNPVQTDFLAVCLDAKCYRHAAAWIRAHRRLRVDVEATALVGTDVHLFYYYAALIFTGIKDFRTAHQCCRLALSVPVFHSSPFFDVAVMTFKLYVLLSLLVFGKAPAPLKYSSYPSSRLRKSASQYVELAYAFENRDIKELKQIFESNRVLFEHHGYLGLVKQVVNSLSKELIVRLTNSFVTMRVADVGRRAGLRDEAAAHSMLVDMIRGKQINASIDDRTSVVRLMDNDIADENAISRNLSSGYMNDCVNIVQRVEAFRECMETDPAYLAKNLNQQSPQGQQGGSLSASLSQGQSRTSSMDAEFS